MSATGYVKNGVYYRATAVPLEQMVIPQQSTWKQASHASQRFDHAAEILQPYIGNQPNPKFIEANPDEAEQYGFTPRSQPEPVRESDRPAYGSRSWGQ